MKTIYQMMSLLFFMLVLSLPALKYLTEEPKSHSTIENRALASLPDLPLNFDQLTSARNDFEAYLKDHFGFKDSIIKRINGINYFLYKETTSKRVSIGKNGYLYLNSHGNDNKNAILKSVCNVTTPTEATLKKMKSGLNRFIDHHQTKGIETAITIIPTKSKIYPEFLPNMEGHWCDNTHPTWIDEFISDLNNSQLIYPLALFKAWKTEFDVFLPKRFHWNGKTPYKMAQKILKHWNIEQTLFPSSSIEPIKSDLNNHLAGLAFFDTTTKYSYLDEKMTRCRNADCITGFKSHYERGVVQQYKRNTDNSLTLLILSDSFGPGITRQLPIGFSEVVSVDLNHLQKNEEKAFIKWIVKKVKPSHMLYVMHDGGIIWQSLRLNRMLSKVE
ncbi:hypothetical protein [Marinicella rhabdoformis]|uniref:hypothetical protein n=1 Tax=Marinicella rhabdoformis TaxID=2580566 RepID=UPI0012AEC7AB|nr:hypothetical protein [Marinicella rhabdoformis]